MLKVITQVQMSRREDRNGELNQDDKDKMVSDAVFYFLVCDQKKSLIKRADICKNCDLARKLFLYWNDDRIIRCLEYLDYHHTNLR